MQRSSAHYGESVSLKGGSQGGVGTQFSLSPQKICSGSTWKSSCKTSCFVHTNTNRSSRTTLKGFISGLKVFSKEDEDLYFHDIYIWRNKGREDVSDLPEELTWLRAEVALVQMPLNFCAVFAPRFVVTEEAGMQKTQ